MKEVKNMNNLELQDYQIEKLESRIKKKNERILASITDTSYPTRKNFTDLTGRTVGQLHVDYYIGKSFTKKNNKAPKIWYMCTCSCGMKTIISAVVLSSNRISSCGCQTILIHTKNGYSNNPKYQRLYSCLLHMKLRCYNPNDKEYASYGGRGITICDEWMIEENYQGLTNFINWAYNESNYEPGLTIERINVDEGYSPENCLWVTREDQALNKTTTRYIQIDRWVLPIICWARITGKNYHTLLCRIDRNHWDPVDAVLVKNLPYRSDAIPSELPKIDMLVIPPEYERFNKYEEYVQKGIIKPVEETIYKGVIT